MHDYGLKDDAAGYFNSKFSFRKSVVKQDKKH